jgi:hypothetical protein
MTSHRCVVEKMGLPQFEQKRFIKGVPESVSLLMNVLSVPSFASVQVKSYICISLGLERDLEAFSVGSDCSCLFVEDGVCDKACPGPPAAVCAVACDPIHGFAFQHVLNSTAEALAISLKIAHVGWMLALFCHFLF